MKCPKCNNPRYKFIEKTEKTEGAGWKRRTSQKTRCNKCKYEGLEPKMSE